MIWAGTGRYECKDNLHKKFQDPREGVNSSKKYDSYLHSTYTLNNTLVKCPIASSCIGMTWQFHYVYILNVASVENASSKLLLK